MMVRQTRRPRRRAYALLLVIVWFICVSVGMGVVVDYATSPGQVQPSPDQWPADSAVRRVASQPTMVLFAHPHCPCTRASIRELALIMARCQGRVATHVLLIKPDGFGGDWTRTDLWRLATDIPGVEVAVDEGGREARRFGGATSGHTLLYDTDGSLLFSGGTTASRGHSGDNVGRSAIITLLTPGIAVTPIPRKSFVFGCPLFDLPSDGV